MLLILSVRFTRTVCVLCFNALASSEGQASKYAVFVQIIQYIDPSYLSIPNVSGKLMMRISPAFISVQFEFPLFDTP